MFIATYYELFALRRFKPKIKEAKEEMGICEIRFLIKKIVFKIRYDCDTKKTGIIVLKFKK